MKDNCGKSHGSYFRTAGIPLGKKEWCCSFHEQDKSTLIVTINQKNAMENIKERFDTERQGEEKLFLIMGRRFLHGRFPIIKKDVQLGDAHE